MTAKILIVDDLKFNIDLLEEHLQNDLYEIHRAYNGQEALSKTLSVRPDLILMDVMMPVIDGLSATKTIRQTPEISHIPIIIITALTSVDDRINSLFCGADDYMNKPINYNNQKVVSVLYIIINLKSYLRDRLLPLCFCS